MSKVTNGGRRVLLIDDSEVSLHFAQKELERLGWEVRTATRIEDLDALMYDWQPDVILTDVQMPGMSGPELCQLLKNRYQTAEVPVVLFSGLSAEELQVLARDCGADGFLSKKNGLERLGAELDLLCETVLF